MVSLSSIVIHHYLCTTPTAIFLFFSILAIVALCANHGSILKKKQNEASKHLTSPRSSPSPSPSESPQKQAKNIGVKVISQCIKPNQPKSFNDESCVWKKDILMGEKCQPLDFSGAIYYDSEGNRLPTAPPARPPKIAVGANSSNLPATYGLEQANRDVKVDVNSDK